MKIYNLFLKLHPHSYRSLIIFQAFCNLLKMFLSLWLYFFVKFIYKAIGGPTLFNKRYYTIMKAIMMYYGTLFTEIKNIIINLWDIVSCLKGFPTNIWQNKFSLCISRKCKINYKSIFFFIFAQLISSFKIINRKNPILTFGNI